MLFSIFSCFGTWIEYIPVATTRPETICGDTAVCVHPDDERFKSLIGKKVVVPMSEGRTIPVIADEYVDMEFGTGALKITPGHDPNDYTLGKKFELPFINVMNKDGSMNANAMAYDGLDRFECREKLWSDMEKAGLTIKVEAHAQRVPRSQRGGEIIEPMVSSQWFVKTQNMGEKALDAVQSGEIQIVPPRFEKTWNNWLEDIHDWCISRQRTWGVPLCLLVHKDTDELHPDTTELMEKVAKLVEEKGMQAWFDLELETLIGDEANHYVKVNDTLDVWFDSGVTHQCVLDRRDELQEPADMYLEGSDQHRGWFQSSLLTGIAINDHPPFKEVLTHGFVVDAKGQKMSKSLGNVVAPMTVINKLGADILRLWVASTDYRSEITASDEILNRTADTYRRLRNTARFFLANLNGFDPKTDLIDAKDMLPLDRWAVDCALKTQNELREAYDEYNFLVATQKMHHFCAMDMGSFYLDIIKDRQYTAKAGSHAHKSCQTALYHIIQAVVRWFMPVMSFTAQELWPHIPGNDQDTIFWETWYEGLFANDEDAKIVDSDWQLIAKVKNEVNRQIEAQRKQGGIGSSLEAEVVLYAKDEIYNCLSKLQDELRFVLITSKASVKNSEGGEKTELEGLGVEVNASSNPKCERCWHRREDLGVDKTHPELCGRCVENVEGEGEVRHYA